MEQILPASERSERAQQKVLEHALHAAAALVLLRVLVEVDVVLGVTVVLGVGIAHGLRFGGTTLPFCADRSYALT